MALKTVYICSNCGETHLKWLGRCQACGEWNTLVEDVIETKPNNKRASAPIIKTNIEGAQLADITTDDGIRLSTGIPELDRVLGSGLVKGSVVLIGGEPGAGKSTLLLQACGHMAKQNSVLYVSGEESPSQIKLRADRLEIESQNIEIAAETDVETLAAYIAGQRPGVVVVDSIQTMRYAELASAPGSIAQVRECTSVLQQTAKTTDVPIFVVGHVNKDGAIAGPKVMEHIVDTVLYFEGDRYLSYRILRAAKNRFGSTNEVGIFDMSNKGLSGVLSPSVALLEGKAQGISGSCVTCVVEGTRAILSEVQSLVAKTGFSAPRRTASGFDYNRANLLLAVLEKRAGYAFSTLDVYVNVAGGLQLDEPATDLAIAVSLISSLLDKAVPGQSVAFGEIGLGGEVRGVSNAQARVEEAARMGFTRCLLPSANLKKLEHIDGIELIGASSVGDIKKLFVS